MVVAGLLTKVATKLGWKGLAMGSIGGLGGLLAGSAFSSGGGDGGILGSVGSTIGSTFSNLGSFVWITLGLGVAFVAIDFFRGSGIKKRR